METAPGTDASGSPREPEAIKRIVFREVPLGDLSGTTLEIAPGPGSRRHVPLSRVNFGRRGGRGARPAACGRAPGPGPLRPGRGRAQAATASLAGLVLVLDEPANAAISDIEGIPALLTGFFGAMQQLVSSPDRKFCLLITRGAGEGDPAAVAIEGLQGMFLDAALEYDSVLFRSVALDGDTDLETGIKHALSLDHSLAEIRFHGQEAFTVEGHVQPLSLIDPPDFALNPGEVVVISGRRQGHHPSSGLCPGAAQTAPGPPGQQRPGSRGRL